MLLLLTHNLPSHGLLHPDSVRHAHAASVRAGSPRAAARPGPADEEARSARAAQAVEVGYGDAALLDAQQAEFAQFWEEASQAAEPAEVADAKDEAVADEAVESLLRWLGNASSDGNRGVGAAEAAALREALAPCLARLAQQPTSPTALSSHGCQVLASGPTGGTAGAPERDAAGGAGGGDRAGRAGSGGGASGEPRSAAVRGARDFVFEVCLSYYNY